MSRKESHAFDLEIQRQPDDSTCGPTCLHAVFRYFGGEPTSDEIMAGVRQLEGGGTLAVNLPTTHWGEATGR